MVQASTGRGADRRARTRAAKRRDIVAAAGEIVEVEGLDALTIKGLASRLDCAVGTVYTYFDSKDALVAVMQAEAIAELAAGHDHAMSRLEPVIDALDPDDATLARLVAFGELLLAAERHQPQQFHLQQRMLMSDEGLYDEAALAVVVPVAMDMLDRPRALLDAAAAAGTLHAGNAFDRTVTWVAATNGVLMVSNVDNPDVGLFDTAFLVRNLNRDLLTGWGADPARLAAVSDVVTPVVVERAVRDAIRDLPQESR